MNGTLGFQAGTTPLESRSNPMIYAAIVIAIIIVAVCFAIWFILLQLKKREENPRWIEKERMRPTKYKDITKLSKFYTLQSDELSLLWYICKKYEVPNIFYAIKQFDELDPTFKQTYLDLKLDGNEQKINRMFLLKFKLDKFFAESVSISSSTSIGKNTRFHISFPNGTSFKGTLEENKKDFFLVALPDSFSKLKEKPAPLSKVAVSFSSKNDIGYIFVTRIIRYQQLNNKYYMALSHSNQLIKRAQRAFKRIQLNEPCRFSSVKEEIGKNEKKEYIPNETKVPAMLTNISGGGCCIASKLPIKESQFIYTEFDLKDGTYSAIGKIVKTRKIGNTGIYNLHIQFINIYIETQNKILAKVYNYD